MVKRCSKCKTEKDLIEFHKDKNKNLGLTSSCKVCISALDKIRHSSTYIKKKKSTCIRCPVLVGHNSKRQLCRSCITVVDAKKDSRRASEYYRKNKSKVNSYRKQRYSEDIQYRLSIVLRTRLNSAICKDVKSGSAVSDLGCSIEDLKRHLESKFTESMSWNNWGKGFDKWHIDHIKPLSKFDLKDPEELKKACNYTNLQPLWETDNLRKGAKRWH